MNKTVVTCPKCKTSLVVDGTADVYECYDCGGLFRVQVGKRMVKQIPNVVKMELYVSVDCDSATKTVTKTNE